MKVDQFNLITLYNCMKSLSFNIGPGIISKPCKNNAEATYNYLFWWVRCSILFDCIFFSYSHFC